MQDEINEKVVALVVNNAKFGTAELCKLLEKFLQAQKGKNRSAIKHGKQTVINLMKQNTGLSNIEITEGNIKDFEATARKYNIDFALKKDRTEDPPKYMVFFKARDVDVMTAAFKDYTRKTLHKSEVKKSVLQKLHKAVAMVKEMGQPDRVKKRNKDLER